DDRAADLAIGKLVAVHGGDEAALDVVDELGNRSQGHVEGVNLKFDLTAADDDLARGGRLGRRRRGLLDAWTDPCSRLRFSSLRVSRLLRYRGLELRVLAFLARVGKKRGRVEMGRHARVGVVI